jgi:hypothetical protein
VVSLAAPKADDDGNGGVGEFEVVGSDGGAHNRVDVSEWVQGTGESQDEF